MCTPVVEGRTQRSQGRAAVEENRTKTSQRATMSRVKTSIHWVYTRRARLSSSQALTKYGLCDAGAIGNRPSTTQYRFISPYSLVFLRHTPSLVLTADATSTEQTPRRSCYRIGSTYVAPSNTKPCLGTYESAELTTPPGRTNRQHCSDKQAAPYTHLQGKLYHVRSSSHTKNETPRLPSVPL